MEINDKIIKGLISKMEALDKGFFEIQGTLQDISQRLKVVQFSVAKGVDTSQHLPKGEGDTEICQDCGVRTRRVELLNRTRNIGEEIVFSKVCKKCFYKPNN